MNAKPIKFKPSWLERSIDIDGKSVKLKTVFSRAGDFDANCSICVSSFSVSSKGFGAFNQHMKTDKHKDNVKTKLNENQQKLKIYVDSEHPTSSGTQTVATFQLLSPKEETTKAELVLLLNGLSNNCSLNSFDHFADVLKCAISDSQILQSFTLNRTKATYILNFALGPYFYKKKVDDINKQLYYTLLYDETVNNANQKELQICIRYFSDSNQRSVTRHLQTFNLGTATAKIIVAKVMRALNEASLSIKYLLMLGSDGPKTNDLVRTTISNELLQNRRVQLLDIGSCNLHVVHNSFSKGLKVHGDKVADLITQTFNWFNGNPARREKFETVCKQKEIECKSLVKHVDARWLTLKPAAERFLYLLPALRSYFMNMNILFTQYNSSSDIHLLCKDAC